ncbi:MAG: DUF5916 domain-containing protein [Candidatus Aminicenantes bacterium]|jgi:hypothetical protein
MIKKTQFRMVLICLLSPIFVVILNGMEKKQEVKPGTRYIVPRIGGKVKFDGLSNEAAWKGIKPLPAVMQIPHFGNPPSQETEFLLAYDDEYLYLAGRLYESDPAKIQGASKKRDTFRANNDQFGIIIDSFNDKENALYFFTTPTGLRTDMAIANDAQGDDPLNISWNTFWDVKTVVNRQGWFAEIRIPFSSLRFLDQDGQVVMGITIFRWIARNYEMVIYPAFPQSWGPLSWVKPSQAREMVFNGIYRRKPLYIAPYVLGGLEQTFALDDTGTSYKRNDEPEYEAGLDLKYSISSNLTLDVTVNTDFAQVEADDQQINLTRFSLFFPEKRLFFQERSGIFDFSFDGLNTLFYSRRIGIYGNKAVRIYGGIRMIGRVGSWDLGFLSMQAASMEDLPSENFGVLRIRRQVLNPNSYVGGMVTSRIGMNGAYNIAYGVDSILHLFGQDYLKLNWAQTFEKDQGNKLASPESARIHVNWERRTIKGFAYSLDFSRAGKSYNPGIGFETRQDFTRFGDRIMYGWMPGKKSQLLSHSIFFDGVLFLQNSDRAVESAAIGPGYEYTTKSGASGIFAIKQYHENVSQGFSFSGGDNNNDGSDSPDVPADKYTFYGLEATYISARGKLFRGVSELYAGGFYDGWRLSLVISPQWSISPDLELTGTYQFDHIEFPDRGKQYNSHILRLRIIAMLSTKFSATTFIQYNNTIDTVIANLRIRYSPREGNDLYLVYNEGFNTNRLTKEILPPFPFSRGRTILLKYTYTFKL